MLARGLLHLSVLFGMFAGGGFLGLGMARWAAPGSGLAAGLGVLLLPAAFALGLLFWSGREMWRVIRRRARAEAVEPRPVRARFFLPLALVFTVPGGLAIGLLRGGEGPLLTTLGFSAIGYGYGRFLSALAEKGYLPEPTELDDG